MGKQCHISGFMDRPYPKWKTSPSRRHFSSGSNGKESACNMSDLGSIPRSGRSLEKETTNYSSIQAWRIPRTDEPDGLQSTGLQSQTQKVTNTVTFHCKTETCPVPYPSCYLLWRCSLCQLPALPIQ